MASIRDLRTRIRSVGSIRQITRAMEMVATTKLRRFQDRAVASRPYANEIAQLLGHMAQVMGDKLGERPLFKPGRGKQTAILIVTSERGLCGAYNSNMFRELETWLAGQRERKPVFFVYGKKGFQYLTKRGFEVERFFVEPPLEKLDYRGAKFVARTLREAFLSGRFDEVLVFYTAFESVAKYVPTKVTLLPVGADAARGGGKKATGDVILEPDVETLVEKLVPRYVETRVYNALLESLTSEYASRRMSMKNATDAATEMGNVLKKQYNRKRQETITKELLDIVGGAEALR
ncbi:MAG: ATP synthase F1 subunit gamma [Planctomycetes bacterium]|nr:ATP synthase F1 subunit gamma [Planctomycetota bacterium]